MKTSYSSNTTRLKVGFFTLAGLGVIVAFTMVLNDRPYWWRACQPVMINVEDATGLKNKSAVRSLGIDIGYLSSVSLTETHVTLGICITAPVEVLSSTRAYIRGEGFLGDKFVELKPVKYLGTSSLPESESSPTKKSLSKPLQETSQAEFIGTQLYSRLRNFSLFSSAHAEENPFAQPAPRDVTHQKVGKAKNPKGREIPVEQETQDIEHVVNRVDDLVHEMTGLANNLKEAINPEDLKRTMKQLNNTLENASKTLAPEGGLTQTAQRTLAKLEDAIEQLRDQMVRVNKGEGSLGMILNDPTYAEEIRLAIKNVNRLLNKVGDFQFIVDIGGVQLNAYNGGRAWFQLGIWPRPDRYYLLGVAIDPRGRITNQVITTTAGGFSQKVQTQLVEQTGLLFTAMLGKVFYNRFDLAIGALYGDGAGSVGLRLGPNGAEDRIVLRNDIYVRTSGSSLDDRISVSLQPIPNFYIRAGLESVYKNPTNGLLVYFYGAGLTFNDEDIKFLFSLK